MIEYISRKNKKNLILFIHGLTGSNETWINEESNASFSELLLKDEKINNHFDTAYFEYFTSFLNVKQKYGIFKSIFSKNKTAPINISIKEISQLLNTRIDYELINYDNIILIAHSMGGLVAKNSILNYVNTNSKLKLFISLAVPHLGSDLANYGEFISSNIQMKELQPLSNEIINLQSQWLKSTSLPVSKYYIGAYEGVVNNNSAVPLNTDKKDIVHVNENHRSICKPKDENNIVISSVSVILKEFLKNDSVDDIDYDFTVDSQYDNEYFVLKLLIADVHESSIKDSKKHFYYSEVIRKIFTSKQDKITLKQMYARIESLYSDIYGLYTSGKISTSTELVSAVHQKIIAEDKLFLKSVLEKIDGLHKKGMIHQLANDMQKDIFWLNEKSTEDELNKFKAENV